MSCKPDLPVLSNPPLTDGATGFPLVAAAGGPALKPSGSPGPAPGRSQIDLFEELNPSCGECALLGAPIESGVRYCHGVMTWIWAHERRACGYRKPRGADGPSAS